MLSYCQQYNFCLQWTYKINKNYLYLNRLKAEMKPRNCQSVSHEVKNEMMKEIVEFLVEQDSKESSTKIEEIVKIFDQARKSQKF